METLDGKFIHRLAVADYAGTAAVFQTVDAEYRHTAVKHFFRRFVIDGENGTFRRESIRQNG
jgi:hypothetical protein